MEVTEQNILNNDRNWLKSMEGMSDIFNAV